ncbi:hypothetical protein [uncultured Delftia sp.]|jgi:hypothetical protein|uniref:hypothetical protein n=1 Tax=uncultured Delftia sp. TaxID=191464 RepID=UPI002596BED8|nr:hypothetical protein [uncultured Delftia sp.]
MIDTTTPRGGAGRGQGRKPLSDDGAKAYKLLLTDEQRAKLADLGNAAWVREQINFATHLDSIDMSKAVNLSSRYINALRQLPQYQCNNDHTGPLTHVMTGVRVLPTGDLADEDDDSGLLEVVYPGGHRIVANAHSFFAMAVAEGAQLEVATRPDDLGIKERNLTPAQKRTAELLEHLQRKHTLE